MRSIQSSGNADDVDLQVQASRVGAGRSRMRAAALKDGTSTPPFCEILFYVLFFFFFCTGGGDPEPCADDCDIGETKVAGGSRRRPVSDLALHAASPRRQTSCTRDGLGLPSMTRRPVENRRPCRRKTSARSL